VSRLGHGMFKSRSRLDFFFSQSLGLVSASQRQCLVFSRSRRFWPKLQLWNISIVLNLMKLFRVKIRKNRNKNRRIAKNQRLQGSGDSTDRFLGLTVYQDLHAKSQPNNNWSTGASCLFCPEGKLTFYLSF